MIATNLFSKICLHNLKVFTAIVASLLLVPVVASSQSSLSIVDALAPYKLNPILLANGHFSITTNYYPDKTRGIIYQEDGSSGRPVNYTSHYHLRVDDVVYQLPYEEDTATRTAPPPHPIKVTQLYRDTINGIPRINARSIVVLVDGDTLGVVFTMFPNKRPSGGFVQMSMEVENRTSKNRKVGVLMLIDTKIADNDQAPIATSFGYSKQEAGFRNGSGNGIPDFWLAMEGTPIAPGLVARGNLRDDGLLTPDELIFGNWTDYTSQGIRGLASVQWKERTASGLDYTDSAILLLWNESIVARGGKVIKAATEIGIADSLSVAFGGSGGGGGGGYGSGGIGLAGVGSCLTTSPNIETPCGQAGFTSYTPDTLQALYLVTNLEKTAIQNNVRVGVVQYPLGVNSGASVGAVIPTSLIASQTGVATVSLVPLPRLQPQSYRVPVAVVINQSDTLLHDSIDICVPGLQAKLFAKDRTYAPVCPQESDVLEVKFKLEGTRCLKTLNAELYSPTPSTLIPFSIQSVDAIAKANDSVSVFVRYAPTLNNTTPTIGVILRVEDYETLRPNDTTKVVVFDTAYITAPSRVAEFLYARQIDTLKFGRICVGDTATGDWDAINVGGCVVSIVRDSIANIVGGGVGTSVFSFTSPTYPIAIPRLGQHTFQFRFTPKTPGAFVGYAIIESPNAPFRDTLILTGFADVPTISLSSTTVTLDSICVGAKGVTQIPLRNNTSCPVVIDSIVLSSTDIGWNVNQNKGFVLSPNSSFILQLSAEFATVGTYRATVSLYSGGRLTQVLANVDVIERKSTASTVSAFGDVLLGTTSTPQNVVISAVGNVPSIITSLSLIGLHSSDYKIVLPQGVTLPDTIQPGSQRTIAVEFTPSDIEQRSCNLTVQLNRNTTCPENISIPLSGRGIQPLIDVRSRTLALGRVCAGSVIDTVILIRNLGNAPLILTSTALTGSNSFTIQNQGSIQIQSDSTFPLRVRYQANTVGNEQATITLTSNGKWITPTDTTITVFATGVVCGTLSIDTISASVGVVTEIPIRFTPNSTSSLTAQQLVALMNQSSNTALNVRVGYSTSLLEVVRLSGTTTMLGSVLPTSLQKHNNGIDIISNSQLSAGSELCSLQCNVLLGKEFTTPLTLDIVNFANGFHQLTAQSGLLRAEYCAFDKRRIDSDKLQLLAYVAGDFSNPTLQLYSKQRTHLDIELYSTNGEKYSVLHNGELPSGSHSFHLPESITSGAYIIAVRNETESLVLPCLIVR
jgi:hypothetical protein